LAQAILAQAVTTLVCTSAQLVDHQGAMMRNIGEMMVALGMTAVAVQGTSSVSYSLSDWRLNGLPDVDHGPGRWISGDFFDGDKIVIGNKQSGWTPSRRNAGYPDPFLVFNKLTGKFLNKSFGREAVLNVSIDREFSKSPYGPAWSLEKMAVLPADPSKNRMKDLLWFADYETFTVTVMTLDGKILQVLGRDGDPKAAPGSPLKPAIPASQTAVDSAKFGNPAGIAFFEDTVFISDGEDYSQQINRVAAWQLDETTGTAQHSARWIFPEKPPVQRTPQEQVFRTPHSIVYHKPSGKLFVGDRGKPLSYYTERAGKPGFGNVGPSWELTEGHAKISILDPHTGAHEGDFNCPALELSVNKPPLSMATFQRADGLDLLFISVGGYNSAKGGWSDSAGIYIVDIVAASTGLSCSSILQHLPITIEQCDVMHDMKVDPDTGDVYVFCPGYKGDRVRKLAPKTEASRVEIAI
jgi:hypothetical protein